MKAKAGDRMYHIIHGAGELIEAHRKTAEVLFDNGARVSCVLPSQGSNLFFEGQITINEYCGESAEGIKLFKGMKRYGFTPEAEIWAGKVYKSMPLDNEDVFSRSYATEKAAEAARDKHFAPKTYPLPEWLDYICGCAIRLRGTKFAFSEVRGDWTKYLDDSKPMPTAHLQECKLKDVKVGEFFTLAKEGAKVVFLELDKRYAQVSREGEVMLTGLCLDETIYKIHV